jgi:two-component system chemotaxis response regulator CheB
MPGDQDEIRPSRIYVAPPDYHLVVESGRVRVWRGPRENRHRPAIDPLFRSAARSYGRRVAGVLFTGEMDDGVNGLRVIQACGGVTIVQDPSTAVYPTLPRNALSSFKPDYVAELSEISRILVQLTDGRWHDGDGVAANTDTNEPVEVKTETDPHAGRPSLFTCPECHGTLWELDDAEVLRFRCRVGHGFTPLSLKAAQFETLEAALWAALRSLEESAHLERRVATAAHARGDEDAAEQHERSARSRSQHADLIRQMLLKGEI